MNDEWQSMATAPKDGRRILAAKKPNKQQHPADIGRVRIIKWAGRYWRGEVAGTYFQDENIEAWMPLPDPPKIGP